MMLQIEAVVPMEKGRARIQFDNGVSVILHKREMQKLSLEEGSTVSEELYQIILSDILGKRAIRRAMHLLEQQDRTEQQLYGKLQQSGYPKECIERAIDYVKSYHYIDDLRYASSYVRCHQEKKSMQTIKADLIAKGVHKDLIERALTEEYTSDEIQKISELLKKRHYEPETADEREIRRTYQFLMRRGFKNSDVLNAMRQMSCN